LIGARRIKGILANCNVSTNGIIGTSVYWVLIHPFSLGKKVDGAESVEMDGKNLIIKKMDIELKKKLVELVVDLRVTDGHMTKEKGNAMKDELDMLLATGPNGENLIKYTSCKYVGSTFSTQMRRAGLKWNGGNQSTAGLRMSDLTIDLQTVYERNGDSWDIKSMPLVSNHSKRGAEKFNAGSLEELFEKLHAKKQF